MSLLSGTKSTLSGFRDTFFTGVMAACRRGHEQQNEPRKIRRRKARAAATTALEGHGVLLSRLVYVMGVAGIGLLFAGVISLSHGTKTGFDVDTSLVPTAGRGRDSGGGGGGGGSGGVGMWSRRLVASTPDDGGGQQLEVLEETSDETDPACEDNNFSDGGAGTVVLLVLAILFTFNGLAIVCDEFFQASLEKISEVLGLTPDVAGATFLAAGSSAPELFTSIADVFGPSNSIGVGTIVGSAMFNVLVIVALSAAVAARCGSSAVIDHRVVARDVSFYSCSIFLLVVSASDGYIRWWEALIMVLGYGLYIVCMVFNARILSMCSAPRGTVLPTIGGLESEVMGASEQQQRGIEGQPAKMDVAGGEVSGSNADGIATTRRRSSGGRGSTGDGDHDGKGGGEEAGEGGGGRKGSQLRSRKVSRTLRVSHLQERRASEEGRRASYGVEGDKGGGDSLTKAAQAAVASVTEGSTKRLSRDGKAFGDDNAGGEMGLASNPGAAAAAEGSDSSGEEEGNRLAWPDGIAQRLLFIAGLPFVVALSLTIPDCSRPKYEKYYIVTFVMSILWISIISSFMVKLATGAACILGVTPIVMGTLVLAVGTSVPDMIGSMLAAKNGEASMAIANAIGSNVFNILLGLGGPWLVSSIFSGVSTEVNSEGATTALIILFCAVMMFVASLMLSRWSMNTKLAYSLLATYFIYVVYTITAEALK